MSELHIYKHNVTLDWDDPLSKDGNHIELIFVNQFDLDVFD